MQNKPINKQQQDLKIKLSSRMSTVGHNANDNKYYSLNLGSIEIKQTNQSLYRVIIFDKKKSILKKKKIIHKKNKELESVTSFSKDNYHSNLNTVHSLHNNSR
jgi:hypothetical protein